LIAIGQQADSASHPAGQHLSGWMHLVTSEFVDPAIPVVIPRRNPKPTGTLASTDDLCDNYQVWQSCIRRLQTNPQLLRIRSVTISVFNPAFCHVSAIHHVH